MLFRGIRNRVLVQFWLLFLVSMLLIDILVLLLFLDHSTSLLIEQKRILLEATSQGRQLASSAVADDEQLMERRILPTGDLFILLRQALPTATGGPSDSQWVDLEKLTSQTLVSGSAATRKIGSAPGFLFSHHDSVILTFPLQAEGEVIAAGGLQSSLSGIYDDFGRIQKIVLVFVVINSFFFALVGNRSLARIYFRPLKRLAKRAEAYQDEESLFFAVRKEDNEFSVLSTSLNKMLHRIAEDKRVLNETIESLKQANIDLKKAQNDVIRAEKLATVGRLTSGIAHEVGNPIGIVLGYLDLMRQADLTEEERNDFIDRSEKEITRINHIIRQLLDMSRTSAGEYKPVSVNQLLSDLVSVFNYQPSAAHIDFEESLNAADDQVFADPDRLRQVFLNILLNAVDAVHGDASDTPCIRLVSEAADDAHGLPGDLDRRFIRVTIADNGPGIEPSHLPHLFDPFYTTKPPGKGTGLGLSVSFMIVEKLGGTLSVANGETGGAVFDILLPLSMGSEQRAS